MLVIALIKVLFDKLTKQQERFLPTQLSTSGHKLPQLMRDDCQQLGPVCGNQQAGVCETTGNTGSRAFLFLKSCKTSAERQALLYETLL